MPRERMNQRGAGGLGCLILILITAAVIYVGLQFGLPELRHRSFTERMNETFLYFEKQPEDIIRSRIIATAAEFDIALAPAQVRIEIRGNRLAIDVGYEKKIDLKFWSKQVPYRLQRTGSY